MDAVSSDAARALGASLGTVAGHHVISSDLTAQVLDYHDDTTTGPPDMQEAKGALSRAKENFFKFRYEDADRELSRAISSMEARRGDLSGVGPDLVDAYITKAVIAKSRGDKKTAREAMAAALKLNPKLNLDSQEYPPSLVAIYNEEAGALSSGPSGTISVKTSPEVADVYMNGIRMGVTPLDIEALPAGSYNLKIQANKYAPIERLVSVAAGRRTEVSERLGWVKGRERKKGSRQEVGAGQIGEGLRIADIMKADKVILVDVDDAQGGRVDLSARMVDRKLRTGQPQISTSYRAGAGGESEKLAEFTAKLSDQVGADLLANPQKNIDPENIGDPAILEKRKKKIYRRPLFWAIVGGIAVGGLAGGLAAAFAGGGSGGPGSIRVEFR